MSDGLELYFASPRDEIATRTPADQITEDKFSFSADEPFLGLRSYQFPNADGPPVNTSAENEYRHDVIKAIDFDEDICGEYFPVEVERLSLVQLKALNKKVNEMDDAIGEYNATQKSLETDVEDLTTQSIGYIALAVGSVAVILLIALCFCMHQLNLRQS